MRKIMLVVLLGAGMLSGCSIRARFYAVQGPLAAQSPAPIYTGKFTGLENSGGMTVVTSSGEVCSGRWTRMNAPPAAAAAGAEAPAIDAARQNTMAAEWDAVYGSGFYVAHVLGSPWFGQGRVTGNRGTVLDVEFFRPAAAPAAAGSVRGVARDNQGNLFKVVF